VEETMNARTTIGGLVLTAALLAGTAAIAQDQVTLTYIASQGWINDAELELGRKFEEETGIRIDYQIIPADQYFNVLKARLNSGEGPDIYGGQSGYSDLLSYNVAETAVDLSNEPWVSRLDPLVAEASSVDGVLYGLTYWDTLGGPWLFNYNKQLFEENGLSAPATFEELKHVCTVLLDAGVIPIYEPFSDGWHHVLMFAELGPSFAAKTEGLYDMLNANQAKLADNEAMLTNINQINELYQMGCFGDDALSDTFAAGPSMLVEGKAAILYAPISFSSNILNEYPDYDPSNIGVFIPPIGDNQIVSVNPAGPTKFIYSGSEHIDAAKEYFNFLTRPDNMAQYMAHPDGHRNLPFSDAEGNLPAHLQAFLDENADNKGVVLQTGVNYVNPQWMDIGRDITAMVTGMIDAKRVLSNIDARRAEMAKAAGDPAFQ
jgi:raffinose/stachyose/melibiose transport system substrate-binding protein